MYCCELGSLALILVLSASHHFFLIHGEQQLSPPPDQSRLALSRHESVRVKVPSTYRRLALSRNESVRVNAFSRLESDDESEPDSDDSPPQTPPSTHHTSTGLIVGAVIGSAGLIVAVCVCTYVFIRRKERTTQRCAQQQPQPRREEFNSNIFAISTGRIWDVNSQRSRSLNYSRLSHDSHRKVQSEESNSNKFANSTGRNWDVNSQQSQSLNYSWPSHDSHQKVQTGQLPSVRVHSPEIFEYQKLDKATNGFSQSNLLGQGGFGSVYKGIVLDADNNKKMVAIKKLNPGATQGMQEFLTEVDVISRAHHRHVVSLVGYFVDQVDTYPQKPVMLVYEFISNNTLAFHLHGNGAKTIDWKTRMKIAIGSAKGLAYLHEGCKPKIIHRDIKPPNILLDHDFQPKIADFGLAKLSSDSETHVSTRLKGTTGYFAPEYFQSGIISEKSDVFAFGVVLLELITGRKPHGSTFNGGMVKWARPLLSEAMVKGNFGQLADAKFRNAYNAEQMLRMVSCAANCTRDSPERRPLMNQVVDALEGKVILDNSD